MRGRGSARLGTLALTIVVALVAPAAAGAAVYQVTTPADSLPQQPCTAIQCSLRSAVEFAAASDGEPDLIQVPAGTYVLTNGALNVASSQTGITLAGAGAGLTIISGNSSGRVLAVGAAPVTVTGATLRDGDVGDGQAGGNVTVGATGRLSLAHVRVTGGSATRGGGIAALQAQLIQISNSLIDSNTAAGTTAGTDGGGGIWIDGQTSGNTDLQLQDSTVAFNTAREGGGIALRNNANAEILLRGTTVANNRATLALGGGLFLGTSVLPVHLGGTILAGNVGSAGASNCGGVAQPLDDGGNVESGTDCGLSAAGRQSTDPQLSAALVDGGGQTPVLSIPATSPAVDIASCTTSSDQRDVARPQGAACDAGAYEYAAPAVPPPPTPPPTTTPSPTPILTPTPMPTPDARKSVVLSTVRGRIRVRLPGSNRFVALSSVRELPLGTVVDATKGRVRLTSAVDTSGAVQSAVFYDGIFKVGQTGPSARLLTVAALAGPKPSCKARSNRAKSSGRRKSRRLWGDGKGRFQTKGQYSSATVRGTKWLVRDSCAGTLTRVTRGSVTVRDFRKRRNIVVRAGRKYLALP